MDLTIFSDGGSLSNPGKAACSFLIYEGKRLIIKNSFYLGIASNNVAEYNGLISALEEVKKIQKDKNIKSITCIADSNLMVSQLNGIYKVKHPDMKKLFLKIKQLEQEIGIVPTYKHVQREKNQEADDLVKEVFASLKSITPGSEQA